MNKNSRKWKAGSITNTRAKKSARRIDVPRNISRLQGTKEAASSSKTGSHSARTEEEKILYCKRKNIPKKRLILANSEQIENKEFKLTLTSQNFKTLDKPVKRLPSTVAKKIKKERSSRDVNKKKVHNIGKLSSTGPNAIRRTTVERGTEPYPHPTTVRSVTTSTPYELSYTKHTEIIESHSQLRDGTKPFAKHQNSGTHEMKMESSMENIASKKQTDTQDAFDQQDSLYQKNASERLSLEQFVEKHDYDHESRKEKSIIESLVESDYMPQPIVGPGNKEDSDMKKCCSDDLTIVESYTEQKESTMHVIDLERTTIGTETMNENVKSTLKQNEVEDSSNKHIITKQIIVEQPSLEQTSYENVVSVSEMATKILSDVVFSAVLLETMLKDPMKKSMPETTDMQQFKISNSSIHKGEGKIEELAEGQTAVKKTKTLFKSPVHNDEAKTDQTLETKQLSADGVTKKITGLPEKIEYSSLRETTIVIKLVKQTSILTANVLSTKEGSGLEFTEKIPTKQATAETIPGTTDLVQFSLSNKIHDVENKTEQPPEGQATTEKVKQLPESFPKTEYCSSQETCTALKCVDSRTIEISRERLLSIIKALQAVLEQSVIVLGRSPSQSPGKGETSEQDTKAVQCTTDKQDLGTTIATELTFNTIGAPARDQHYTEQQTDHVLVKEEPTKRSATELKDLSSMNNNSPKINEKHTVTEHPVEEKNAESPKNLPPRDRFESVASNTQSTALQHGVTGLYDKGDAIIQNNTEPVNKTTNRSATENGAHQSKVDKPAEKLTTLPMEQISIIEKVSSQKLPVKPKMEDAHLKPIKKDQEFTPGPRREMDTQSGGDKVVLSEQFVSAQEDPAKQLSSIIETKPLETKANRPKTYLASWDDLDTRPLPQWFDKAKIGIIVRWGVYSVPAHKTGEWFWYEWKKGNKEVLDFMNKCHNSGFAYQDFAPMFKGEFFNADVWATLFQNAGAQYVIMTAKHHDGFKMFQSKNAYMWNSVDSGLKRDIVKELSVAVKKKGLDFGIYYSLYEWFHPVYQEDKKSNFITNDYVNEYVGPDLIKLVNVHKPTILWLDGDWDSSDEYWKSQEFLAWLYNESSVGSRVVVNDRLGTKGALHGDFHVLTRQIPHNERTTVSRKWEKLISIDKQECMCYRRDIKFNDFLTTEELIKEVVATVSQGGNILINVSPNADGMIDPLFEERLIRLGEWLSANGEAIYGTSSWIHGKERNNDIWYTCHKQDSGPGKTVGTSVVYAIFFEWPPDGLLRLKLIMSFLDKTPYNVILLGQHDTTLIAHVIHQEVLVLLPDKATIEMEYAWTLKFVSEENQTDLQRIASFNNSRPKIPHRSGRLTRNRVNKHGSPNKI